MARIAPSSPDENAPPQSATEQYGAMFLVIGVDPTAKRARGQYTTPVWRSGSVVSGSVFMLGRAVMEGKRAGIHDAIWRRHDDANQ